MYVSRNKKYITLMFVNDGSYRLYKTDKDTLGWELVYSSQTELVNDKQMVDLTLVKAIAYMNNQGYELLRQEDSKKDK